LNSPLKLLEFAYQNLAQTLTVCVVLVNQFCIVPSSLLDQQTYLSKGTVSVNIDPGKIGLQEKWQAVDGQMQFRISL